MCDVCKWTEIPFEPCPNAIGDGAAAVTVFWPIDLAVVGKLSFRNIRYGSARAERAVILLELRTHLCEWFGYGRECNGSHSSGLSYDHGADPSEKPLVCELLS